MHRHQRNAPSRVRLGTVIVGIALSLMMFGMSPAEAATTTTQVSSTAKVERQPVKAKVIQRTIVPKWVSRHRPAQIHINAPGGPVYSTVDWQWLYGRWQIRFNWAETRQMSRGFSYCNLIAGLIPHWTARVVSGACGALWVFADVAVNQRKCVEAYVSIAPTNPISFGKWDCQT